MLDDVSGGGDISNLCSKSSVVNRRSVADVSIPLQRHSNPTFVIANEQRCHMPHQRDRSRQRSRTRQSDVSRQSDLSRRGDVPRQSDLSHQYDVSRQCDVTPIGCVTPEWFAPERRITSSAMGQNYSCLCIPRPSIIACVY